jgi:plasmid maintenance system antidote protein VapI/transposase
LLGVGRPALSNLLNGKATLSPDMALRIEKAFGASQKELLEMQARFDESQARTQAHGLAVRAYVPAFLKITARDIEQWVDGNLKPGPPCLVLLRKLVHSTGQALSQVDFPGYDNAQRKGWDGRVDAGAATPWIQLGKSGWEFGCDVDPRQKAEGDYAARVDDIAAPGGGPETRCWCIEAPEARKGMVTLMKRLEIQVLRRAGHSRAEVAKFADVSERTVIRVGQEAAVTSLDDVAERERRGVGRPSKAEPFREFVVHVLQDEPAVMSLEILRRARLKGYAGAKTALYALLASVRPPASRLLVRFEGLYKQQARELDRGKREALLQQIQQILHDRVRFAPIWEYSWPSGIGPRVDEPALMLINPYPWSAPLEEVRLKRK